MCYVKKIIGFERDENGRWIEANIGPDFDGQFHCARYNCKGCHHRLVDGQLPKRNQRFRTIFEFSRNQSVAKTKIL